LTNNNIVALLSLNRLCLYDSINYASCQELFYFQVNIWMTCEWWQVIPQKWIHERAWCRSHMVVKSWVDCVICSNVTCCVISRSVLRGNLCGWVDTTAIWHVIEIIQLIDQIIFQISGLLLFYSHNQITTVSFLLIWLFIWIYKIEHALAKTMFFTTVWWEYLIN